MCESRCIQTLRSEPVTETAVLWHFWGRICRSQVTSESGKAVFRLFRLLLLLRMDDRVGVEVKTK